MTVVFWLFEIRIRGDTLLVSPLGGAGAAADCDTSPDQLLRTARRELDHLVIDLHFG
jgi:hypothetical protein